MVNILSHLPYLKDVVFSDGGDDPWFIGVPTKVGDLTGVAAMDEEELRRTIFFFIIGLFVADAGEIPDVQAAVGAGRGEDGFVVRVPLHLEDLVGVGLERVESRPQMAEIPEPERLVGRTSGHEILGKGRERETVDLLSMGQDAIARSIGGAASIPDEEMLVVTDASKKMRMIKMPSNIFDHCSMPGKGGQRRKRFATDGRGVDVPETDGRVVTRREQMAF